MNSRIFTTLIMLCLLVFEGRNVYSAGITPFDTLEVITPQNASEVIELFAITEIDLGIGQAVFNADASLIAYSTGRSITVWDTNAQAVRWKLPANLAPFGFSPDDKFLGLVAGDSISLWNVENGSELLTLFTPSEPTVQLIQDVAFSTTRSEVVAVYANAGAGLARWNADTGEFVSAYTYGFDRSDPPDYSILSLDGRLNAVMPNGQTIELRNTVQGDVQNRLPVNEILEIDLEPVSYRIQLLAISNDNRQLLLNVLFDGSPQSSLIVVLSSSGEITAEILQEHGLVSIGTFSPNSEIAALGNRNNGEIYLWDAATGEALITLTGHTEWITSLTFNAEGTLLMSSSTDGTVQLWGVPAGGE